VRNLVAAMLRARAAKPNRMLEPGAEPKRLPACGAEAGEDMDKAKLGQAGEAGPSEKGGDLGGPPTMEKYRVEAGAKS